MLKFAAALEYQGTNYSGWQKQPNLTTVASCTELALSRVANHPIEITAAGRTDRGVHASQQIIHFESSSNRNEHNWLQGTNSYLPSDIRLLWVTPVANDFHARFSAHYRRYIYLIYNHHSEPALLKEYCSWQYQILDIEAMQQAATSIIGYQDFNAFRSSDCQAPSSYRRVDFARISRHGKWVRFDIQANAFLHKMVRMLVAELIIIGKGRQKPEHMLATIEQTKRQHKPVARPSGLFLCEVGYPEKWQLPTLAAEKQWIYQIGR